MINKILFNQETEKKLFELLPELSREQLVWLHGYVSAQLIQESKNELGKVSFSQPEVPVTILYGTHTGHSKKIAEQLYERIKEIGFSAKLSSLDNYKKTNLKKEKYLFLIVSTHGQGEPPVQAEEFYEYVLGKRAPQLSDMKYSILALGDKSYKKYCQTGVEFDQSFSKLGAEAVLPIQKVDVDYEKDAENWMNLVLNYLQRSIQPEVEIELQQPKATTTSYSRSNPFKADVLDKIRITTPNSEKEIYHIEISLEGSGLTYKAGDSVGIFPKNPSELVTKILDHLGENPNDLVSLNGQEYSALDILREKKEITVLNRNTLYEYNKIVKHPDLEILLNREQELDDFLHGADLLDLIVDFPGKISFSQLIRVLRNLPARLYSISSGPSLYPDELHITLAAVRYRKNGRDRTGTCSTFLTDQIEPGEPISIYIEPNDSFRLPENENTPVIFIGAGTGIAPYRAFAQELENREVSSKSWLFFGNQKFKDDFLYQLDWQKFLDKKTITKMNVAFSRDQKEKIYIQNQLINNASEIYKWIEQGAHIYICGDKDKVGQSALNALSEIITAEGGLNAEQTNKYMKVLRQNRRLLMDTY